MLDVSVLEHSQRMGSKDAFGSRQRKESARMVAHTRSSVDFKSIIIHMETNGTDLVPLTLREGSRDCSCFLFGPISS